MMKVVHSIRNLYNKQHAQAEELAMVIRDYVNDNKEKTWHYFDRIKEEESFALKIEAGKVSDLNNVDDFFACTIVVDNSGDIKHAKNMIKRLCVIRSQKPDDKPSTTKSPDSFPHDDLRLCVKLRPDARLPPDSTHNKLAKILFEVQIKTFLQHAWSVATHDLVYKNEEISWAKSRIAYQIKAMLEHAEVTLYEIDRIKKSKMLKMFDKKTKELNEIKKFITSNWKSDALPSDMIRLSNSVNFLLDCLNISTADLQTLLDAESGCGRGVKTLNLSPYFTILQTIINQKPELLRSLLAVSAKKIIIPAEVDTRRLDLNENKIIRV